MVKNDICLGDPKKQNALFFSENVTKKSAPMPPMSIIGSGKLADIFYVQETRVMGKSVRMIAAEYKQF